jgi:hypothetical protein
MCRDIHIYNKYCLSFKKHSHKLKARTKNNMYDVTYFTCTYIRNIFEIYVNIFFLLNANMHTCLPGIAPSTK